MHVSSLDSKRAIWNSLVPKKNLALTLGPEKVRKDFAEKQMTGADRLISGQGFQKLLFLELAEDSFTLISGSEVT